MIFMEQEVKSVIQEVVAVDNKDKSAYIREAVIYYHRHKGISPENDDVMDHIRLVVQECNQQLLAELDKRIGSKDLIDYDKLKNIF